MSEKPVSDDLKITSSELMNIDGESSEMNIMAEHLDESSQEIELNSQIFEDDVNHTEWS